MSAFPHPLFLLTDFGVEDPWVGVLKGVIRSLAPDIPVSDLSHAVPPGAIDVGQWFLDVSWEYLPEKAVVLACVDPGVGSGRRIRAVRYGLRWLVGPDNGILSLRREADSACELPAPEVCGEKPAPTFQARDIMAPACARLARGWTPHSSQEPPDLVRRDWLRTLQAGKVHEIPVLWVDRFGNVILPVPGPVLENLSILRLLPRGLELGRRQFYSQAGDGELFFLHGSHGFLELAMNGHSAASCLGIRRGDMLVIEGVPTVTSVPLPDRHPE